MVIALNMWSSSLQYMPELFVVIRQFPSNYHAAHYTAYIYMYIIGIRYVTHLHRLNHIAHLSPKMLKYFCINDGDQRVFFILI